MIFIQQGYNRRREPIKVQCGLQRVGISAQEKVDDAVSSGFVIYSVQADQNEVEELDETDANKLEENYRFVTPTTRYATD